MPEAVAEALSELSLVPSAQPGPTRRGLLAGATMAAAAAASLALVAPLHAAAISTVQGTGTDWHLGYYAMMCVLFAFGMCVRSPSMLNSVPSSVARVHIARLAYGFESANSRSVLMRP